MEIRKGPYGQFVVETASGNLNKYAAEIICNSMPDTFLRFYIALSPISGKVEISYDCTELTVSTDQTILNRTDRTTLRKAAGDLFLSFLKCLDFLIPLNGIEWNNSLIFWDNRTNKFKMCLNPYYTDSINLSLQSLGNGRMEKILNDSIFNNFLSSDEISRLCSAINSNNESVFEEIALSIKKEDPQQVLKNTADKKSQNNTTIKLASLLFIISFCAIITNIITLGIIGILICSVTGYLYYSETQNNNEINKQTTQKITTDRKNLLFTEEKEGSPNIFSCITLKSKEKIKGTYIAKSIYTNKATIGSDQFLSDICIDDQSISAVHAEILQENNIYKIKDLSHNNTTYIDNQRLEKDTYYELKSGQVVRCGDYDFDISIGL